MERKCYNYCKCPRCLDRNHVVPGSWIEDEASLNYSERLSNQNGIASAHRPPSNYQVSYAKGENRVRFDNLPPNLPAPPVLPPPPQPPPAKNLRFDHTFPKIGGPQICRAQRQHQQRIPGDIERELYLKTNLVREQQRQLDELRSRMVIPVLPESHVTTNSFPDSFHNSIDDQGVNHLPLTPNSLNHFGDARGSYGEERGGGRVEGYNRHRQARRAPRYHRSRRAQHSLNRNNNNNNHRHRSPHSYSASDSESYDTEEQDEDEDVEDDDPDEDETPLMRNEKNNNNTTLVYTDPANPDIVLVEDRCCGTCCAIAAIVTCGVLVILIVYPILYLIKHSSIHF